MKSKTLTPQILLKKIIKSFSIHHCTEFLHEDIVEIGHTCMISLDNNEIQLSFEVDTKPTYAAIITQQLSAFLDPLNIGFDIMQCYLPIFNDKDEFVEILFGEEEIENYFENIEVVLKTEPLDKIDPKKQVDIILDKISEKGIKSLNKEQKEFLNNYSKRKIK